MSRSTRNQGRSWLRPAAVVAAVVLGVAVLPTTAMATPVPAPECATLPSGAVQVTADCTDSMYANPVIDSESDETTPVVYHKVAGHFEGTTIQFNIYLPPAAQWKGRFFQWTYPLTDANADDKTIQFALASGGYAVQAGGGTSLGYRHDAAAAKFAKTVAAEYYGSGARQIYGYLFGASGGSYQVIGSAENTTGVWEGYVPMVLGTPMSIPYNFFIRAMADLVLADKADQISDAVKPGGSGDPYAGLDAAQQTMLHELTNFGVPLRSWENPSYLLGHVPDFPDGLLGFGATVKAVDPSYVTDFWNAPGYLGTEQSPLGDLVRAALAKAGDTVDNRWDIALRAYYRYQLPPAGDGYAGFDQFRNPDGTAKYPQRPFVLGPAIGSSVSGQAAYSGKINGRMIVVDTLYDVDALPTPADWYAQRVKASLGASGFTANFRVYYQDHSDHLFGPVTGSRAPYLVDYLGTAWQALRDVSAWVERGVPAPASTRYSVQDQQITVPSNAALRQGIQPTVNLSVRGGSRVEVKAGESVSFTALAHVPLGTGKIVATAWDFEGDGTYTDTPLRRPLPILLTQQSHRFTTPGVYYVSLRVTAQRDGLIDDLVQVQNLDRVRVVVTEAGHGH